MSRLKLRVGDVFVVPLDEARVGIGQVVATYGDHAYFFALFEPAMDRIAPDIDRALSSPVAFLALSLDAKVVAGHWAIIGNRRVDPAMPLPAFKEMVGDAGRVEVVDYSGKQRRPTRDLEADWLPNRTVVAPVRLENALKARFGLGPWNEAYRRLEPSQVATTALLFGD